MTAPYYEYKHMKQEFMSDIQVLDEVSSNVALESKHLLITRWIMVSFLSTSCI